MTWLVRKINKASWPDDGLTDVFDLKSNAIYSCLRCVQNGISVWQVDDIANLSENLKDPVLALATNSEKIETFDVVVLDGNYLKSQNIKIEQTEGITIIEDLKRTHFDICDLTYFKIGLIAEHIIYQIGRNKIKRFTVTEIKQLIKQAVEQNRIEVSKLNPKLAEKLKL